MYALIDCNNFYTSCERVFAPHLVKRPIVVLSNNDGCIISRSEEAKKLGIKMGAPYYQEKAKLAEYEVAVFSSNYALYGDLSKRIMEILKKFSPHVEIYSIDEAFIDFSHVELSQILTFATKIKNTIMEWVGIPVSIGIGRTKTLSKIATEYIKKEKDNLGVFYINNQNKEKILRQTNVKNIWGIGWKTVPKLIKHNINTAWDLINTPKNWIQKEFKIIGLRTFYELEGMPCIRIEDIVDPKKSITTSRSFGKPITSKSEMEEAIAHYTTLCAEKLRREQSTTQYITVYILTNRHNKNYTYYHAYKTSALPMATDYTPILIRYAIQSVSLIFKPNYHFKKAGVIFSGIQPKTTTQLSLLEQIPSDTQHKLMNTLDMINKKKGEGTVVYAKEGLLKPWRMKSEKCSPQYTTNWNELLQINLD